MRGGGAAGGGGGDGSGDDSDDAGTTKMMAWRDGEQTDGWSMVASEEGDVDDESDSGGAAGVTATVGEECDAGEPGCPEEKQEGGAGQEERMVQWEFVNGYLEEVGGSALVLSANLRGWPCVRVCIVVTRGLVRM